MVFDVTWDGAVVGTVTVQETPRAVTFFVDCIAETSEILRCYGQTDARPLRLCVLEPQGGHLRAARTLTRADCPTVPQAYFLAHGTAEMLPRTGDSLLDAALASGNVHAEQTPQGLRLSCAFDAHAPFALSFAAAGCRIEQKNRLPFAVLEVKSVL